MSDRNVYSNDSNTEMCLKWSIQNDMLFSDNSVLTKPHAVMRRYELLTETKVYLAVNDVLAKQGRQLLYSCRKHSVFF